MKSKAIFTLMIFFSCTINMSYSQYNWEEVILPDSIITYTIAFNTSGKHFIATSKGVYTSEDGDIWEQSSLTEYVSQIHINENNTIYVGMDKLFRSYDNGITWDSIFYAVDGSITSLCTKGDSSIFLGTWGGIHRSTDSAQTWTHVLDAFNSEVFNAIVPNSEGTLFAGSTAFIGGSSPGGVYRSDDNGSTWALSNLDYHFVSSICINSYDEIFVGTRGHFYTGGGRVFKSIDNGINWEIMYEHNLINTMNINTYDEIAIGCRSDGYPGGIFCSYDDGENWAEITNDLPSNFINEVKFSPYNYLYSITKYDYKLYRTETVVIIPNRLTNNVINRITAFPNPAKNEINIGVDNTMAYKIIITDISGTQIYNATTIAHNGLININIGKLKPGLYFVHCSNNSQNNTVFKFIKH